MKTVTQTSYGTFFKTWPLRPLQEVAFFQEGPGLRKWQWTDKGMKVINVTNILGNGSIDTSNTERFISMKEFEEKYSHFAVGNGDVVVASSGNTYGKVGRVNQSHLPIMMNTSVIRFHPLDPERLHPDFLYAFLRSAFFRNQVESQVIGSAQPNFGPSHLKRMQIPEPSFGEQEKIAGILSAYDDLIANNSRRIAVLEEMAQSLYREWFVSFRFPGHEQSRFIETEQSRVPEGWQRTTVGDLAEDVRRGVQPDDVPADTPYLGLEHLPRKSITLADWGEAREVASTKLAFKRGEILFGKIRPYFHKVGVALVDGVCSSDAIVIAPRQSSHFGPVICCVSSKEFVEHASQTSQGTKMPRANWDVIRKFSLPTPPQPLLDSFNAVICAIVAELRLLVFKNRNLRRTRDLLLPKLISGEVDVEHLDIDTGDPVAAAGGQP